MNIFKWIKFNLSAPIATSESKSNGRNFATDYAAASKLLRDRLDTKFPDNYHASFESRLDRMRDHGAERKDAIDAISKEISLALRQGATVRDAAARGAKAVGLQASGASNIRTRIRRQGHLKSAEAALAQTCDVAVFPVVTEHRALYSALQQVADLISHMTEQKFSDH